MKIRVLGQTVPVAQVRAQQRNRAAEVAYLVRYCRGRDPVASHELLQTLFFAVAHLLGRIHHDGGQAGPSSEDVGRKPHVCQEDLAVLAVALTLRRRARPSRPTSSRRARPAPADTFRSSSPKALPFRDAEQILGGGISGQNDPVSVGSQDCRRTALREQAQLLLGFPAQRLFRLDARQMLDRQFMISHQNGNEKAGQEVSRYGKDKAQGQLRRRTRVSKRERR